MKVYHGSRNGNLKALTTNYARRGTKNAIYLTENYEVAVFYAGCSLRFWKIDETGKLIVREQCQNGLDILYGKRPCYIYSLNIEEIGEYEIDVYHGRKSIRCFHDVDLTNAKLEYIPDALEKLLQLEREGKIIIWHWENYPESVKQRIKKEILSDFASPQAMQIEYFECPDEYDLLVKMYPESAIIPDREKYQEALIWLEKQKATKKVKN